MNYFSDWTDDDIKKYYARTNKKDVEMYFDMQANKLSTQNKKTENKVNIALEIPIKLPSLNDYIKACRSNKFLGAKMKKEIEQELAIYINSLPEFDKPIKINFTWIEQNKKRDLDNICFAKKFILDALQKCGKLQNDNRRWVTGFTDNFEYGEDYKVILEIKEV